MHVRNVEVIRAMAGCPTQAGGPVTSQTYSVMPKADQATVTPAAGPQPVTGFSVHLARPARIVGGVLNYTTDGSDPLTSSTVKASEAVVDLSSTPPVSVTVVVTGSSNAPSDPVAVSFTKK